MNTSTSPDIRDQFSESLSTETNSVTASLEEDILESQNRHSLLWLPYLTLALFSLCLLAYSFIRFQMSYRKYLQRRLEEKVKQFRRRTRILRSQIASKNTFRACYLHEDQAINHLRLSSQRLSHIVGKIAIQRAYPSEDNLVVLDRVRPDCHSNGTKLQKRADGQWNMFMTEVSGKPNPNLHPAEYSKCYA